MRSSVALVLLVFLVCSPAGAADFETAPVRTATQILGKDTVSGPGYTIRERVTTRGFFNHYEIESRFGLFEATSDRMLQIRLREIETMQRLMTMDAASTYMKALEKRLVQLPTSLVDVAKNPGGAVKNVPKAVEKTFGRVGSFLGGIGKSGGSGGPSPEAVKEGLVSSQKRKLAIELMVDVHSSNAKLQQMLEDVATARYAGEFTVSLASYAIPGGAGTAVYSTASWNADIVKLLSDMTEEEVVAYNAQQLRNMGTHEFIIRKYFEAPGLTPRHETLIIQAMRKLRGVRGLDAIPQAASEAQDETQALLQEQQALALAAYHQKREPIVELRAAGAMIMARTRSGRGVILGPVDILWHNADTDRLLQTLAAESFLRQARARDLEIKGRVTQRFVDRAKALGFRVVSGWPGLTIDDGRGAIASPR